jgi:hypothetical protein
MKYKTVKIDVDINDEWYTYCYKLGDVDRVDNYLPPHPIGHFHYPETMDDEEAFNQLKQCMVDAHLEEIKGYQQSLDKLQKLSFKPKQGHNP